jgi:phenylpropionate dioxygenase-like ring-hydroxylating dioxygenase large terminal subunit
MFVNVSGDAPPLLEYLEAIPETLGNHDFGELAPLLVVDEVLDVNWKVLVDNFGEDYHCPLVHKETLCATFLPQKMVDQEWTNSADIYTDERLDSKAAASGLFDEVSPNLVGDTRHRVHVFRVFPQLSLVGNPNGEGWIQQYTPLAPASTRVRVWVYKRYPHEGLTEDEEAFIHRFMGEDFQVSARIQKGLASPLYTGPGPIHRLQKPARIFRKRLLGLLRDAVSPGPSGA